MVGQLFSTFIDSGCVEIVPPMSTLEYRVVMSKVIFNSHTFIAIRVKKKHLVTSK